METFKWNGLVTTKQLLVSWQYITSVAMPTNRAISRAKELSEDVVKS